MPDGPPVRAPCHESGWIRTATWGADRANRPFVRPAESPTTPDSALWHEALEPRPLGKAPGDVKLRRVVVWIEVAGHEAHLILGRDAEMHGVSQMTSNSFSPPPEAVGVNGLARRPELVTGPASLDDAFPKMKKSHDMPAKRFTVAVKLLHDAGRPRRAIRRGALLAGAVQRIVNEVAPGTDVDLVIPHRYTERLAHPPSRRNEVLLRLKDVVKRTGLSRSTLYRLERAGEFPKRRELSKNIIAWGEHEVLAWIMNRKRRGSDGYRA
jgi:prophage regulatory protein